MKISARKLVIPVFFVPINGCITHTQRERERERERGLNRNHERTQLRLMILKIQTSD
jgi:hypothetical protein